MEKQHAVDEFIANIKNRDLIKARVIIDYLADIDPAEQRRILFELNKCDDDFSIPLLAYLSFKHPEVLKDNPQLGETLKEKALNNQKLLLRLLSSSKPELIIYVDLAGKTQLRESLPLLRRLLKESSDDELIKTAIRVLGEMKDSKAVDDIGEFLFSNDTQMIHPAVQALGNISNERALRFLYTALEKSQDLDTRIIDMLASVQDETALELLNRTLVSKNASIRAYSKTKLARIGSNALPALISNLEINNPDLQIHSLNVLLEIGDAGAVKAVRNLLNTSPPDANVRFAAYETLAYLPPIKGDYMLATGLTDPDDSIRLAAARAVERNLDKVLLGGVRNMIQSENAESIRIIKAIIDAQTTELFVALLDIPLFERIIFDYVALKVHSEIRNHYLNLLREKGFTDLADRVEERSKEAGEQAAGKLICAVDDSGMILSVYRRILNELGFEPVLFQLPRECLEWLEKNRPAAVFTDLNMPEITGIELSKRIREAYTEESLPVIMVTTQKEGKDDTEMKRLGINRVINKPFDADTIRRALKDVSIEP